MATQFVKSFTNTNVSLCARDADLWMAKHPKVKVLSLSSTPPVYIPNRGLSMTGMSSAACVVLLCSQED